MNLGKMITAESALSLAQNRNMTFDMVLGMINDNILRGACDGHLSSGLPAIPDPVMREEVLKVLTGLGYRVERQSDYNIAISWRPKDAG